MKLSELIAFRNRLDELPVSEAKQAADHKLNILMHTVTYPLEQSMLQLSNPFIPELEDNLEKIHKSFDEFNVSIEKVKKCIRDQIGEQEKHWFQESYRLFEEAEMCEKTDQILYGRQVAGTKNQLTINAEDTLRARLSSYADWRWPGMIIRPGIENYIDNMVGCDPLYIIDRGHDLLEPSIKRFPKLYQNRLRSYTTNDWSNQLILEKIPNNQFGVCLAYNVFNYRPLEIIRRYLEEIYTKLRPGGVLLMTYNDCDRAQAVMLVEQFCASYTPGYLIRDLAQSIGFELTYTWGDGGPSVWLELHKPGQLVSNRGGQTLAKIHSILDYSDDIDFLKRKAYTQEEIDILFAKAKELKIKKEQRLSLRPFELQMLINKILNELHQKELEEREHQRITKLAELAREYNINVTLTNWQELVILEQRKREAISLGIDVNNSNWEHLLKQKLEEIEKERLRLLEEERKIAEELERKRIVELHTYARSLGIDPEEFTNENEIHRRIAEENDKLKKQELVLLRQRAMELNAGDPNLIRYGYSAEKLKQLIKAKEEGQ